jgi:hypothetical protein
MAIVGDGLTLSRVAERMDIVASGWTRSAASVE